MKVINLFAGPGAGKSTTAAGLFYQMKKDGYKVELLSEYAKKLVYQDNMTVLGDQLMILAKQHHMQLVLDDQVDYLITDSPFIMGTVYTQETKHMPKVQYDDLVMCMYNSYDNVNIFLERNLNEYGYKQEGRTQTLEEAQEKDNEIKDMLKEFNVPYYSVLMNDKTLHKIMQVACVSY